MTSEDEYIGQPLSEVPKRDPTEERCMGRKKQKQNGEIVRDEDDNALFGGYCGCWPGKGTDHVGEGRCSRHGGLNDGENGQGAKEGNTNAVTHGAYADQSTLYSQEFTDAERETADKIFRDYRDRYLHKHGDLPHGHRIRLFKISVNAVTELRVEQWEDTKPEKVDSGVTYIDRETELKEVAGQGVKQVTYSSSPALAAKKTLSNENRMWLKDLGLLDDPESQKADATQNLADAWQSELERGSTE